MDAVRFLKKSMILYNTPKKSLVFNSRLGHSKLTNTKQFAVSDITWFINLLFLQKQLMF